MSRISRNGKSFCWCTGCTYLFGGPFLLGSYRGIIKLLTLGYSWLVECQPREKVWVRWREVPCSVSAEYLSHTGFRLGRGWHQPFQKCHCVNMLGKLVPSWLNLAGGKSTQLSSETDINRSFFIPESAPKKLQVTQVAWYLYSHSHSLLPVGFLISLLDSFMLVLASCWWISPPPSWQSRSSVWNCRFCRWWVSQLQMPWKHVSLHATHRYARFDV